MNVPNQTESAIFAAALDLPAEERTAYFAKVCGFDAELRRRLEDRLKDHLSALGDSAALPIDPDATINTEAVLPREEMIGETIGHYTLVEKIGEGGFGSVYVAEQSEPVKRRVAFKITKLGMDTKEVVARFKRERQALATMDHPSIAKVLDAGSTESGRPYFVMELVHGKKITEYCDEQKLSTHKRLELFIQVCRAIEHAHQKGIIHRDIKPSNILVTVRDGKPEPKVIDFGIAKATHTGLTEQSVFTQMDQFVGTPAYMSPEQAEMGGVDIDTRTDIYSLGVLLYELLTAQTPLESHNLLARGFDEMRRMIREFEPQLPSLRLGDLTNAHSTSAARLHGTDAPKLIKMVQGDLDWVVMKCLEKDRSRRYETAGSLAADVQRFLDDEPVEARPPSELYRFQKLVRRNKLVFGAGFALWMALVIGLGMTIWSVRKERQALHVSEVANARAEDARQQALRALKKANDDRSQAELAQQQAEAALHQSEADRALAVTANSRAAESEKKAQAARREADLAVQKAQADRDRADAAEKKAQDSRSKAELATQATQAAESRALAAASKSEQADKAAATEAALRRKDDATTADALAKLAHWREAMADLMAGLDVMPPSDALKAANAFLMPEDLNLPWAAPFLRARGDWHARLGESAAAIADFSLALKLQPGDPALHLRLAPLLAENGKADEYGRHCAQFLKQNRETNNPALALVCLLAPAPDVDASSLAAQAHNALAPGAPQSHPAPWQLVLSLAEYRRGHFAEAADAAGKALSSADELGDAGAAQANAVLAMAQQRLNHADTARAALDKGRQILDTKMPKLEAGDLGLHWADWVAARQLLHEAQALLSAQQAPKP